METKIVEFEAKYKEQVLDILFESNRMHAEVLTDYFVKTHKEASSAYLDWVLEDKNNFGLLALHDGIVAGFVTVRDDYKKEKVFRHNRFYEIMDIAVNGNYRGCGIGKKLHQALVEKAKANDVKKIELLVYQFNKNAEDFYEKLGYKSVAQIMVLDV